MNQQQQLLRQNTEYSL